MRTYSRFCARISTVNSLNIYRRWKYFRKEIQREWSAHLLTNKNFPKSHYFIDKPKGPESARSITLCIQFHTCSLYNSCHQGRRAYYVTAQWLMLPLLRKACEMGANSTAVMYRSQVFRPVSCSRVPDVRPTWTREGPQNGDGCNIAPNWEQSQRKIGKTESFYCFRNERH
jgi:hypothetical protein